MSATRTITVAFYIGAATESELPDIDDVVGSLENKTGHGLPPSWWNKDRGYWIIDINDAEEKP